MVGTGAASEDEDQSSQTSDKEKEFANLSSDHEKNLLTRNKNSFFLNRLAEKK